MYREYPKFKPEEILVYLRRSRSDDPSMTVEEVLEKHEKDLRDWIERNLDAPIPECNWFREIVSGETIQDRVAFQKILRMIEGSKYRAVLCIECSRISRGDMEECGRIIKIFRYTSTYVITPQRSYDLADEFDREGFEREIKHSNYYLEYSKKLMKRGMDYSISQGSFVKSLPPYGYKKVRVKVGKRNMPTLEIDEDEAKVVRMIFDMYNSGLGYQVIANNLDNIGVKPRKSKVWNSISISKIISNETYMGKIRNNVHKLEYIVQDQNVIKKRIRLPEYQVLDGMHEPIIDDETFFKAKNRKDKNPKVRHGLKMRNPLSSLMYCKCGHAMTYVIRRGVPRFECPEQRRCGNSSVNARDVFDEVLAALKRSVDNITVEINSNDDDLIKKHEEKIAFLKKKLCDIEYKELSLWEKYTEEEMPKNIFDNLMNKCLKEKSDLEHNLEDALATMPEKVDYESYIADFYSAIDSMNNESVDAKTKNDLLKACINRIVYERPGAVRGAREDVKEGQTYERGWIQSNYTIDVYLKV